MASFDSGPRTGRSRGMALFDMDAVVAKIKHDELRSQQALSAWFQASFDHSGPAARPPLHALNCSGEDDGLDNGDDLCSNADAEIEGLGVTSRPCESNDKPYHRISAKNRSKEQLLEQLLGANGARSKNNNTAMRKRKATIEPVPAPRAEARKWHEDSEDDGGRAAAFVSKRQRGEPSRNEAVILMDGKTANEPAPCGEDDPDLSSSKSVASHDAPTRQDEQRSAMDPVIASGYLDQVLAVNAVKKRKKKKRRQDRQQRAVR